MSRAMEDRHGIHRFMDMTAAAVLGWMTGLSVAASMYQGWRYLASWMGW